MDIYNVPEPNYMIQNMEQNVVFTAPYEPVVYSEPTPEFFVDQQGVLYPSATAFHPYYCTGFESPADWDEHQRVFGADAFEIQYPGVAQNESLPYVYYTPTTYGHAQSLYNPYNPYIPGAMTGLDVPFVEPQQNYYYQTPVVPQPDPISSSTAVSSGSLFARPEGRGLKNSLNSVSGPFINSKKPYPNTTNLPPTVSEGSKASVGPSKQAVNKGSNPNGGFPSPASSQGGKSFGSIQAIDSLPKGKFPTHHNQWKVSVPSSSGLSNFGTYSQGQASVANKLRPSVQVGSSLEDVKSGSDSLIDQNRGARVYRPKNEVAVKAYTTKTGISNAQGNTIIYTDQYNKDNFQVEYIDAKFFVIKSYSEDDVHKSIKYNVWSSTPNGNKKLNSAFEDAQRIATRKPGGCPIFLFFSVNMSGQFCGVAEMVGPVDFTRDMDFWQQDKWNGSFPVKWHIIKDVPNTSLRHIILENNENKPVTNSRDTQEIMHKKGIDVLKIFKSYTLKSSILDDFVFYENRQKILQEEKARSLVRSFENPLFVSAMGPPRKLNCVVEEISSKPINFTKKTILGTTEQVSGIANTSTRLEKSGAEVKDDASLLNFGTLRINPIPHPAADYISSVGKGTSTSVSNIEGPFGVKVGLDPPKLNGSANESSGILTFGTVPPDSKALSLERGAKKGFQ